MHPAFSIIVFTTLSGLGYGLAAVLGLGVLDPSAIPTKLAHILALMLIGAGLLSSTVHLGNPQRAWRALSQWRSSWLSREGVMAILTFLPLSWAAWNTVVWSQTAPVAGILGILGAVVTVYCTGMIYASLKSVQAWHTPLTPACFLLFALAGGLTIGSLAGTGSNAAPFLASAAIAATLAAWFAKTAWRRRMLSMVPLSTPETATGLGKIGKVRLFERPHMTENYLTREMGFKVARKHAAKLARISFVAGAVICVLMLLVGLAASAVAPSLATVALALAVVAHLVGVFVERWLFFAEARHAVMNYYGG